MKACLSALALMFAASMAITAEAAGGDRTITKVIKMLQEMVEKSKADGEKDVKLFAKFQCFCDSNQAEKTKEIEDSANMITQLGAEIAELMGQNGKLSTENAELQMSMQDNEAARTTADSLRTKANEAFVAEEADLTAAIDSMDQAIDTLSAIGADQTAALMSLKGTVSKKKASMLKLSTSTVEALKAASVFVHGQDRQKLTAFIQAPFTGEYQSQSGEIVGILKNMRDTFKSNLASAKATEASELESHTKFTEVKEAEHATAKDAFEAKEKVLGENDESVGTKRVSKKEAEQSKASDEEFLAKLIKMCAAKKAEFEDRKMIRANEEAAIAQAISILNSDEAFDTFGATKAVTEGGTGPAFLQVAASANGLSLRQRLANKLKRQAKQQKSLKLARIAVSLEGENPFNKVVAELDSMIALIDKEEKEDYAQKEWCDSEREENQGVLDEKIANKEALEGQIVELTDEIENAETGLKKQIADAETTLAENRKAQADEIEDRGLENVAYQANVKNLVAAQEILSKATKVLKKFYDWLHAKQGPHHYDKHDGKDSGSANGKRIPEASVEQLEDACSADPACAGFNTNGYLKMAIDPEGKWYDNPGGALYVKVYDSENPVLLQRKEDPAPPDTFESEADGDGAYAGQTDKATDVVGMLEFIAKETKAEEDAAHTDELNSQHSFEDTITDLKTQEAATLDTLADLKEQLAAKEKALEERTVDHKKVAAEAKTVEDYLLKIKGGCDFIVDNLATRDSSRATEKQSLETAKTELFGTPAYKAAKAEEEKAALGACADKCWEQEETPECKACIEGVSVVGYCSTHLDTPGCDQYAGADPDAEPV
jgi:hypothetical protein